jgi:pimeloyl-ACP methyl ester carboxylesterase
MAFVDIGLSRLYYESYGEGNALIFAHGVGGNHASWHRQIPTFAQTHRVIVFDHRAFGNSTDVEGSGQSSYVSDLLALVDALEIKRAVLVGQSMGGGTSAAFACTHPDRVAGLVIADSLTAIDAPEPLAGLIRDNREATAKLSQAERVLGPLTRENDPETTLLYLQLASFNSVTVKTIKGKISPWSPADLGRTGVPTLFVAGEQDVLFPPHLIRMAQGAVKGSRFELIPGAGHSAYFENAGLFNKHVAQFLQSLQH